MIIGFTGTRRGMSANQRVQFRLVLEMLRKPITGFHHGYCRGADREAEVMYLGRPAPTTPGHRKWARVVRHPANGRPLERNREIVAAVDILIAAPHTNKEILRSGTWATVRYAREKRIPIIMLTR